MGIEQIRLSSPGLTGRPSTPRLLGSIEGPLGYWIPAFAGMTSSGWDDNGGRDDDLNLES
jgi:hypothetical protein